MRNLLVLIQSGYENSKHFWKPYLGFNLDLNCNSELQLIYSLVYSPSRIKVTLLCDQMCIFVPEG